MGRGEYTKPIRLEEAFLLVSVTMKELLEAGVHFGHQVRRWNPKMKEFIFGERNGINIIDLQKTQRMFRDAITFVTGLSSEDRGRTILFVGTKRQAQDAIREEAERAGQFYINQRWLGGLLTNFQTVQKSIKRLRDLEAMQTDGRYEKMTKKERIKLDREREILDKNLSGIKNMNRIPDALFIIDVRKEEIAVAEANRLGIPVIAVVDTNCSPEGIDYIIPGNDDALRAVRLFASRIADAVVEGQQMRSKDAEGEAVEGIGTEEGASDATPQRPINTSSVTTQRDPGAQSQMVAGVDVSTLSTETQVSVPGNLGFGKTGQQPDSIGDHEQVGTGAPVRGASGSGDVDADPGQSSPEKDKGAESVGAAK
ncbi:MAG TPA: 30S ribosomal protein S2 [Pyrinomonadaceae bacterium]|nr:30S ribosomal protein S2 [Pyrinomonadaceae bacterium]